MPAPDAPDAAPAGLLLMAHGAGPEWNGGVEDALAPLRDRMPVALALGMADPRTLQAGLDSLRDRGVGTVAVVRLFVSDAAFLHQTEFLFGVREDPPARGMVGHRMVDGAALVPLATEGPVLVSREGIGGSEQVGRIVVARAHATGLSPPGTAVLMIAHGVGGDRENDELLADMTGAAEALTAAGYAEARFESLREDWADSRSQAERRIRNLVAEMGQRRRHVLVIPYRVFGFGPYAEVLEGFEYASTNAFLPHPLVTDWIAATATELFCAAGVDSPLGPCSNPSPDRR